MTGTTRRSFTKGNRHYRVFSETELQPDLSSLQQDYKDESPADRKKYLAQDKKRLAAYNAGEWEMLMIGCEISLTTPQQWATATVIGRDYLHGVESDAGDYLKEVEEQVIAGAEHDASILLQTMLGETGLVLNTAADLIPCECHKANSACPESKCKCLRGKVRARAVAARLLEVA